MLKMKVYLDNCTYNRPFDDQSQIRISLETEIFISHILREPSDYTVWQKEHYSKISVQELNRKAVEYTKALNL